MITKFDAMVSLCPTAKFAVYGDGTVDWQSPDITQPTDAEISAEEVRLAAQVPLNACKEKAVSLLQATDWTTIPDVADPAVSNPYLTNQAAFAAYRSQVRALAVNPVADPVWPVQPNEEWSQA